MSSEKSRDSRSQSRGSEFLFFENSELIQDIFLMEVLR